MNGVCRYCQCTDGRACEGGCYWVLPDVCSRCADLQLEAAGMGSPVALLPLPRTLVARMLNTIKGALLAIDGEVGSGQAYADCEEILFGWERKATEGKLPSIDQLDAELRARMQAAAAAPPPPPRLWRPGDQI